MRVIDWLRRNRAEVAGAVLAACAIAAVVTRVDTTAFVIPLVLAIFLGLVLHGRRRQAALAQVQALAEIRASLLERQERFLHDASHELRTPVTIARGHLELLRRERPNTPELEVALDELGRIERIVERLLLLAKSEQQGYGFEEIDVETFLSDLFIRWSGVAPRAWRLDVDLHGRLLADSEALRNALDALLENAVKYSETSTPIRLGARRRDTEIVVEVADAGPGIPCDALDRVFERFGRVDEARTRARGGVGLGLAIVQAIAQAHGGHCTVDSSAAGSTFALCLPGSSGGRVEVRAAAVAAPA